MKKKKWGRILSIGFILLSMLIVVLIVKPTGILGKKMQEKV